MRRNREHAEITTWTAGHSDVDDPSRVVCAAPLKMMRYRNSTKEAALRMVAASMVAAALLAGCRNDRSQPAADKAAGVDAAAVVCTQPAPVVVKRLDFPATTQGAQGLVRQFVREGADATALLLALRPDSEDYAAVFDAGLAKRIENWAAPQWASMERERSAHLGGMKVGPIEAGNETFLFSLDPDRLHHPGSALCGEGYGRSEVEKHIGESVTVHCFGFAKPGREPGEPELADALVYVRGHWALFPRPWAVPETVEPGCAPVVTSDATPLPHAPEPVAAPPVPGSFADAKRVMGAFVAPGADVRALLLALKPSSADYHAVYVGEKAAKLEAAMRPRWEAFAHGKPLLDAPDQVLPAPGEDTVVVTSATSAQLAGEDHDCPVGYADVAGFLKPGLTVHCFGFTKLGLGTGTVMDGLIYVGGHWVLIPRPWEVLGTPVIDEALQ